jgi:hypothetical protein
LLRRPSGDPRLPEIRRPDECAVRGSVSGGGVMHTGGRHDHEGGEKRAHAAMVARGYCVRS